MRNVACDLCGREGDLVDAVVEGAMLKICPGCVKFGNVIPIKKTKQVERRLVEEETEDIVSNYNSKIKNAREKFGMTQEDVARRINEKLSVIQKIERGEIKPSMELANKIERFFRIKIVEGTEDVKPQNMNFKSSTLTIGDLVKIKDRKI